MTGNKTDLMSIAAASTKAVLYARVSSREQSEGYSIDAQVKLLREFAGKKGLTIAHEFIEVESAKKTGRPEFEAMLTFFRKNPTIKTLLVEKTDRVYRNLPDYAKLDALKLDMHLVKEGAFISPTAPSQQKLTHGIMVVLAKNYSDNLSEEVSKGMREKASQGILPCHAPLGYKNNPVTRGIDINPEKAPFVRMAFEEYATGLYSLKTLRVWMYDRGFRLSPTCPKIPISSLERMLKSPYYTGLLPFRGQTFQGVHEPLVTPALFEKVQSVFTGKNKPLYRKHEFAFGGVMTCGECGCSITAEIQKGRYVYYRCTNGRGKCGNIKFYREEVLTSQFDEIVKAVVLDEEVIDWIKGALKASLAYESRSHLQAVQGLTDRIKALKTRLERAYEDKLDGKLSDELWSKKSGEWQTEVHSMQVQLQGHLASDKNFYEEGFAIFELAKRAYSLYREQDPSKKQELLRILLSNCLFKEGKVLPEYRQPFGLLAVAKNLETENPRPTLAEVGQNKKWSG